MCIDSYNKRDNINHQSSVSNKLIKHKTFVHTQFTWSNSSIWPIGWTLSGATTQGQSVPASDGNDGELRIPQSFRITGAASLDVLMSYLEYLLVGSYPCVEMQSVYSLVPTD